MRCMVLPLIAVSLAAAQNVFTEVAGEMGISGQTGLGHAAGWCDIDDDDDLDLAFSNQDGSGFWLYRNDDSTFTDITSSAGLGGIGASRIIWGEFTGDEHFDLLLTRGSSPSLFSGDGSGGFTDISSGCGLGDSPACVADFNSDGDLDVLSITSSGCAIYTNTGGGNFVLDLTASGDWWCAACIDYDLDMDPDIYLGTYGSDPNTLLRNDIDSLIDVTSSAGAGFTGSTTGITVGDYDNNGWPDLYLANYSAPGCVLLANQGGGTFSDVTAAAGVTGYTDTRTAAFADYDNDGWLDIFVSHHDFFTYSNLMWWNQGDGTFLEVGTQLGLSGEFMGDYFGTAWGDFDSDGDVDLFAVGHIDKYVLFRNDLSETIPSNYLTVDLRGTDSSRDAIGAMVSVSTGSGKLHRWVGGCEGYHDFHSLPLEFGLYDSDWVDTLSIQWPSGLEESYFDIQANQRIEVEEGNGWTGIGEAQQSPAVPASIEAAPNPCRGILSIECFAPEDILCHIGIYDCTGRLVHVIEAVGAGPDPSPVSWEPDEPGMYLLQMNLSGITTTGKVLVLP